MKIQQYIFVFFFLTACLQAQIDSLSEVLTEALEEENSISEMIEYWKNNPVNLNRATREELLEYPFLSVDEIDSILLNRPYANRNKVRRVLSRKKYSLFKQFFSLKEAEDPLNIRFSQRIGVPLQRIKAIRNGKYQGSNYELYSKINFSYGKNTSAGFLMQKDIGEKYFTDFWAGYLELTDNRLGYRAIIGNYYLQFGHGLIFSAPYSILKSDLSLLPLRSKDSGGRSFLSSIESAAFRGIYANLNLPEDWQLSAFYSNSLRDATFDASRTYITGFDYSGYHRSANEQEKEKLLKEEMLGGYIKFKLLTGAYAGISAAKIYYDPQLTAHPQDETSRNYYKFNGNELNLYSGFVNYKIKSFDLNYELAANNNKNPAHTLSTIYKKDNIGFGFRWWHIPVQFQSPFGKSLSSPYPFPGGEQGFYFAASYKLSQILSIAGYWSSDKKLWRTYFSPMPTRNRDFSANILLRADRQTQFYFRYQFDLSNTYHSHSRPAIDEIKRKFRLQLSRKFGKQFRARSRFEKIVYDTPLLNSPEQGINLYQDLTWNTTSRLKINLRYSCFKTVDYNTRIYEYETDVPASFSNYPLYGSGYKWYVLIHYKLLAQLKFWFKYRFIYLDGVDYIGSGDNEIKGQKRQDVRLYFTYTY